MKGIRRVGPVIGRSLPALLLLGTLPALAQELEPRAYRTIPKGLNFLQVGYSFSTGNVVADATVPVVGLELDAHTVNLLGGPALTPKEFADYRQGRNLGISLTVSPDSRATT